MIKREYGESPTLETRTEAEESVNKKIRYNQIVEILFGGKEMTAKEIAVEMHQRGYIPTTERNYTAP